MRKHLFVALYATFASVFLGAVTSQAQEPRVGFVDLERVAAKSVKFQAQQKKLTDLYDAKRQAMEKEGKRCRPEEMAHSPDLTSQQNLKPSTMLVLRQDLVKIISRIRVEKGLAIVFDREALVWAEEALDLSDEVAKAYDAEEERPRLGPAVRPQTPSRGVR
jgi:Skp family chaperone for outer membrane proteins